MNTNRTTRPTSLVLGSLTAAVALAVGLSGAHAQMPAPAPPLQGAGSFPGSFIVPGTNTSLHVGGVIEMDVTYDFDSVGGAATNGALENEYAAATAVEGAGAGNSGGNTDHGIFQMTAQYTRPNFETRTPTDYGELKTYWEMDFSGTESVGASGVNLPGTAGYPPEGYGVTGTTPCCGNFNMPRLKQAYGTLGPWLFGQAISNYADLDALNDNLDGGQPDAGAVMGTGARYVPQIRFTYLLPNGISLSGSIEQSMSSGIISSNKCGNEGPSAAVSGAGECDATVAANPISPAGVTSIYAVNNYDEPGTSENLPAFVVTGRIDQPWGHVALHVAVQDEYLGNDFSNATTGGGNFGLGAGFAEGDHLSQWGYQSSLTGHLNTVGRDKITWDIGMGEGAANYNLDLDQLGGQYEEGLVCSITNASATSYACSEVRTYGGYVGYSHWWSDTWRSDIDAGYDVVSRPSSTSAWVQPVGASTNQNGSALALLEKDHMSGHANILWTPTPAVQFGLEYRIDRRVVQSGASGDSQEMHFQSIFKF